MNTAMGEASPPNHPVAERPEPDHFSSYQSTIASLESLFSSPVIVQTGQKFLRCQLGPDRTALILVDRVIAVLTVHVGEVLAVPHMPNFVLGIYNWRGEIIWLLDLAAQLGLSASTLATNPVSLPIIIAQVGEQSFGLAVLQIFDIESHDIEQLHPATPGLFSPQLQPFVKGYLADDRSTVLNTVAIINDPRLANHSTTYFN
jgi:positive phototaxis protein PixI